MLERQGIFMKMKKLRRLKREEKLQVRCRGGRKRALGTRGRCLNQTESIALGVQSLSATPLQMAVGSEYYAKGPLIRASLFSFTGTDHLISHLHGDRPRIQCFLNYLRFDKDDQFGAVSGRLVLGE